MSFKSVSEFIVFEKRIETSLLDFAMASNDLTKVSLSEQLENNLVNQYFQILEELKKFHAQSIYQRNKDLLSKEIKEIESEIAQRKAATEAATNEDDKKIVTKAPSRFVTELHDHAFDESDKFVKIFAPFNSCSISDENVELELTENSFCMTIKGESKDYRFNVKNLLKAIDVSKSYRKVKSDMVSIYLKKVKEGKYLTQFMFFLF